jgi:hypothetical protein
MSAIRTPTAYPVGEPVVPEAVARCLAAFARDLPDLLRAHAGKWVAYANGERLRIANTQTELYRECLHDRGLPHEKFIVRLIVEAAGDVIETQPR